MFYRRMGIWLLHNRLTAFILVHALPCSQSYTALEQNKKDLNKLLHRSLFAFSVHLNLSVLVFSTATILDLLRGISGKASAQFKLTVECFHSRDQ